MSVMGKADWLWEPELELHMPCCSQSGGYGHRCHNGPLVGEQITDGDCGQHGLSAENPGGAVSDQAAAFAALTAIEAGEWDRFLLRLRAAIEQRRGTEAYREHVIAMSGIADKPEVPYPGRRGEEKMRPAGKPEVP